MSAAGRLARSRRTSAGSLCHEAADEVDRFADLEEALTVEVDDNPHRLAGIDHRRYLELLRDLAREVDAAVADRPAIIENAMRRLAAYDGIA